MKKKASRTFTARNPVFHFTRPPLILGIAFVLLVAGHAAEPSAGSVSAHQPDDAATQQECDPIPFDQIGAKVTADYKGDAIGIAATDEGARLNTAFQKLSGTVTNEGLRLDSTGDQGGSLRLVASGIGRGENTMLLPKTGTVTVSERMVTYSRPHLTEEYSVSVDGVRQDFVVTTRPSGSGDLQVELALSGAKAEAEAGGVKLTFTGSGRELAYSRLHVVDATGRELSARMEVVSANRLAVRVEDAKASYPVCIDPTFSDADWVGLNPGFLGADAVVRSLVVDGSGNLYAGGEFGYIGTVAANRIAKWNGSVWAALGSGVDNTVRTMAVIGTDLYAGGDFISAGGVTVNRIAKWNGTTWSALGSGANARVRALAVIGTELYAGGTFTAAGGVANTFGIAKWNGSTWTALGAGTLSGSTQALAVSGTTLYAAGSYGLSGNLNIGPVSKWNGSTWTAISSYSNWDSTEINAMTVDGSGNLYVGGSFNIAGGVTVNSITKWNGSSWSALGSGIAPGATLYSLAISGGNLYAGGYFPSASGVSVNNIAKWNGSAWTALGSGFGGGVEGSVRALAVSGSNLYAGGSFATDGGNPSNHVAKWNGSAWSAFDSAIESRVSAVAVSGANLYVGGSFTWAGGVKVNRIAKWNGSVWSALGSGIGAYSNHIVSELAVDSSGNLYAGGYFTTAGGLTANSLAKWNGNSWSSLGTGLGVGDGAQTSVSALVVSGTDLYVGGNFYTAGGVSAKYIAKWNGSAWSALGSGTDSSPYALAINGTYLYAGGYFTKAGGVSVNNIAKWNGTVWSTLGSGTDGGVRALAVIGTDVYAGGSFNTAGGVANTHSIAKWNGSTWSALGTGVRNYVNALAVIGTDLYAGGSFNYAGGVNVRNIAKWNGSAWSSLGTGVDNSVDALATDTSNHLFVGGWFYYAGATLSPFLAMADLAGSASATPSVTTPTSTSVTASTASLGGNVTDDGGATVTTRGVVYSLTTTNSNPGIGGVGVTSVTGTGTTGVFTVNVTGLTPASAYSFKAYATNSIGTGYSVSGTFATANTLPAVATPTSASITPTSVVLGGNVVNEGSTSITARGVVLAPTATNSDPQIGGPGVTNVTASGTTGVFTVNANGLMPGTEYTFKAYATSSIGTGYCVSGAFTTPATTPVITSPTSSNISATSADLGGNVTSDGGTTITARGVVYSPTAINSDPQIGGTGVTNVTASGTTGVFTVNVTGLSALTTYSFKAHATNSMGTSYTVTGTFSTPTYLPYVTAPTSANITAITATLGGTVASGVGSGITSRGVVYAPTATTSNPSVGGVGVTHVTDNGTMDTFAVNVGGLIPNTSYTFRAYATNSAGYGYSAAGTFTTLAALIDSADLSNLVVSPASLSPPFSAGTVNYFVTVPSTTGTVTITPTTTQAGATVKVNTTPVVSGEASGNIILNSGANTIDVVVTAIDGVTTKTYQVSIYRLSVLQTFRDMWYGTIQSTGSAADNADPYHTGVQNLAVYAFFGLSQNPATAQAGQLPQAQLSGGNLTFDFTEPPGIVGITYGAEVNTGLTEGGWQPVTDTGSGTRHIFSAPVGSNPKLFMRLKVTNP